MVVSPPFLQPLLSSMYWLSKRLKKETKIKQIHLLITETIINDDFFRHEQNSILGMKVTNNRKRC